MDELGIYEMKIKPLSGIFVKELSDRLHLHLEWECIICYAGAFSAYINDSVYEVHPGEMILIPPKALHYYSSKKGEYMAISFSPNFLFSMKKDLETKRPKKLVTKFTCQKELNDAVNKMKEYFEKGYSFDLYLDPKLLNGMLFLIMYFSMDLFDFVDIDTGSEKLCDNIVSICLNHYTDEISLKMLSKELNISSSTISHVFNNQMQMRILTFVNWLRISEACRLLRDTKKSITEIAYDVGFSSLRSFNRTFLKTISKTPKEYRQNSQ